MNNHLKYMMIKNYLLDSPNHERKKIEVIRKFNFNKSSFNWILTKLTGMYLIYENDNGRIMEILD